MDRTNYNRMNAFMKLLFNIADFFVLLPGRVWRGIKAVGRGAASIAKAVGRGFKSFFEMFKDGDIFTRISYGIMGFGCAARGQTVKGIVYFLIETVFILFMSLFGWGYLKDIGTLGTNTETSYLDPVSGIIKYNLADNSMLILLYSVLTLVVIAVFLALYFSSIKAAYNADKAHRIGRRLPDFKEDIKSLIDEKFHITLLALPTVLSVLLVILPIIFMVLIAFTNYDRSHQPPGNLFTWVGLANFKDIFGGNAMKSYTFKSLLGWTCIWAVAATLTNYIFGMLLAIMINKKGVKLKKFWRTIFVLTIAVPQFVSLLAMSKIFADQGTMNMIITALGGTAVKFLSNGTIAKFMIILINMWVGIPYSMLICSGILMNIPSDLYESARIDGAGPFKTFTKITLPYMLFVTTPYLITQFVGNFNNFNVIYLLTMGDPKSVYMYQAGETDLLVTWLYKLTVNQQDYNLASVIGIFVFVISAVLSLSVYNSSGSMKREEDFQ